MPQVIIYIVTGYVFIKTFHFVALKQNSADIEHVLTSSLVVGYIYCSIAYLIPISISYEIDTICIIISSLILGYIVSIALRNKKIVRILDSLKIRDTGNRYYWDDIMDNDYPMKIKISCGDVIYEGMLHNYESYSNEPHVIIASYVVMDKDGKIINNFSNDSNKIIILDTSKAEMVEIIYAKDSGMCKDINDLCDSNRELFEK